MMSFVPSAYADWGWDPRYGYGGKKSVELAYKYIAPESQTKYKLYLSSSAKVSNLIKKMKNIETVAGHVNGLAVFGGIKYNVPQVVIASATVGGGAYIVKTAAGNLKASYKKLKKGTKEEVRHYFKWTDAAHFKYSLKTKIFYTYKGKKIKTALTRTYIRNGQLKNAI